MTLHLYMTLLYFLYLKLNFCVLNMQSIRNKCDEFSDYVLQIDLDVIAITETWLKPGDDPIIREMHSPRVHFSSCSKNGKSGGGVALLFKSCLSVNIKDNHNGYRTFDFFACWKYHATQNRSQLVVIYRPERDLTGHTITFSWFLQEFETLVSDYLLHPSEILLTGDFNIHFDTSDSYSTRFKELLSSYGLNQHVNEPTHHSGHCLDFVITRDTPSPLISNIIVNPGFSDHFSIFANFDLKRPPLPISKITTRHLKCILMLISFVVILISTFQNIDFTNDNIDYCVEMYENVLQTTLDKHAPAKKRTVKLSTESPWFNDDIHAARKKRCQLERKWRNNGKLEFTG